MTYDETTPPYIASPDITAPDIIAPGDIGRLDITPAVPLPRRLSATSLAELFALDIKPRGMVLDPIIPEKGLAMLYATRGTGKTPSRLASSRSASLMRSRPARASSSGGRRAPARRC